MKFILENAASEIYVDPNNEQGSKLIFLLVGVYYRTQILLKFFFVF